MGPGTARMLVQIAGELPCTFSVAGQDREKAAAKWSGRMIGTHGRDQRRDRHGLWRKLRSSDQPEEIQNSVYTLGVWSQNRRLQGPCTLEDPLLEIEDEKIFDMLSRQLLELEVRRVVIQIECSVFF